MVDKGSKELRISGTIVCGVAFLLALPALLTVYGFTDDYSFLWKAVNDGFTEGQNAFLFLGRPLTSMTLIPALKLAGTVSSLGWLRLLSLIGILVYALVQDRMLRELNWGRISRIVTGILTISSPATIVWIGWASCFPYAWGAVAALFGGYLMVKETETRLSSMRTIAISTAMLLVSLCFYQPAATAFLVPMAVLAFQLPWQEMVRRLTKPMSVFIGTHLVYLLIYRMGHLAPYAENPLEEKLSIGSSPVANTLAFLKDVLPESFAFWGGMAWPILLVFCGCLGLMAAFMVVVPDSGKRDRRTDTNLATIFRLGFYVSCLLLSMASVLATEGVCYHRTRFGLYALVAVVIGEGVRRALASGHKPMKLPIFSGLCFTVLSILGAGMGSWFGLVLPNAAEYQKINTAAIESLDENRFPRALVLVYEEPVTDSIPFMHSYEFGTMARDVSWALEPMVGDILNDLVTTPNQGQATVTLVVSGLYRELAEHYPVLTVNPENHNEGSTWDNVSGLGETENSIFGLLATLPGSREGWKISSTYGFLNTIYWEPDVGSYIYHLELGWLMVPPHQDPEKGINLYQSDIGWIWTSPSHYPNLYLKKFNEWAYVQPDPYGRTYLLLEKSGLMPIPSHSFDDPEAVRSKPSA